MINLVPVAAKVGSYGEDLMALVDEMSSDYMPIPFFRADVPKRGLIYPQPGGNYIIIISQGIPPERTVREPYNVIISVHGPNREVASRLIDNLGQNLGIELRDPPEVLKNKWAILSSLLQR